MANSVALYAGPYEYGGGGEITAVSVPSFVSQYAPEATATVGNTVGFQTYCVEVAVDASLGQVYSYSLSQFTSQGQVLTYGAAELYWLFGKGLMGSALGSPAYNYADSPGGTRINDAELLQSALWALIGQPNYFGQNLAVDPYYTFIVGTLGGAAFAPNANRFPVDVMELWDYNNIGSPAPLGYQDQLVLVPDGGSTVLMVGGVFTLLAAAGIRFRKRG